MIFDSARNHLSFYGLQTAKGQIDLLVRVRLKPDPIDDPLLCVCKPCGRESCPTCKMSRNSYWIRLLCLNTLGPSGINKGDSLPNLVSACQSTPVYGHKADLLHPQQTGIAFIFPNDTPLLLNSFCNDVFIHII